MSSYEKLPRLTEILRSKPAGTRVIIFCSTKRMCDQLSQQLSREFRASAIHGDKRQQVYPALCLIVLAILRGLHILMFHAPFWLLL